MYRQLQRSLLDSSQSTVDTQPPAATYNISRSIAELLLLLLLWAARIRAALRTAPLRVSIYELEPAASRGETIGHRRRQLDGVYPQCSRPANASGVAPLPLLSLPVAVRRPR